MLTDKNRGQQEMVGFILIVVIVMIGLMVFLIISIRTSPEEVDSLEVKNMLNAIMSHTTECAIPSVPYYDTFEDLFKSCHENDDCARIGQSACEYLNETLRLVLEDLMATEAKVSAYQFDISVADEIGQKGLLSIFEGNCTGAVLGAQRKISAGAEDLIIRLKICMEE